MVAGKISLFTVLHCVMVRIKQKTHADQDGDLKVIKHIVNADEIVHVFSN